MSFSKVIPLGEMGNLSITEDAGIASVSLSANVSAGGGSMAGIASGQVSASVQLSAKQLIDAGLELAAAKFPMASGLIEAAKAGIDAELAKV